MTSSLALALGHYLAVCIAFPNIVFSANTMGARNMIETVQYSTNDAAERIKRRVRATGNRSCAVFDANTGERLGDMCEPISSLRRLPAKPKKSRCLVDYFHVRINGHVCLIDSCGRIVRGRKAPCDAL